MSDAIDYLLQTRPEAMGPYFEFLKKSGQRLDPKTRALISVISKVSTRTERGFRQYTVRALRQGCSADEILDALLAAFPIFGLSGLIWAVDLLLDMDIPEFNPDMLGRQPIWHELMAIDDLPTGVTHQACDGRELFIYREDTANADSIVVYDSRCPHQVTNIPQLALVDCTLTCPKHEWQFDIRTGECIAKGDRPLNRFQHRIEKGFLQVLF
ncbi:MAG: Rieske 2Fe-2S domain-containing protein [Gammaproteobacteria bacterium]